MRRQTQRFCTAILAGLLFAMPGWPKKVEAQSSTGALPASVPAPEASTPSASRVKPTGTTALRSDSAMLADVGLKVAASSREQVIAPNQSRLEFGTINLLDKLEVQQTFTLFNASKSSLVVERMHPSCGCMSIVLPSQTQGIDRTNHTDKALPLTLLPNEQMQVKVTIHLEVLPAGPFNKSVSVYVQGDPRPAAMLQLTGMLQPNVTFTPNVLDFGRLGVSTTSSLILTAAFGDRLKTGIPLPMLVSRNPHVQVKPLIELAPRQPQPGSEKAVRLRVQRYRVTVQAGLDIGPLTDMLCYVPAAGSVSPAPVSSKKSVNLVAALQQSTAMIVGQVIGNVAPQPPVLAYGEVAPGQEHTRQIVLRSERTAVLQNMKLIGGCA